jgi:prepilin-type processing-associated H-X9-DG protein
VGAKSSITYSRAALLNYTNLTVFRQAVNTGTVDVKFSYAVRTMRWGRSGEYPALLGGKNLQAGDRYIYAYDRGPLARYNAAAIVSDTFVQEPSGAPVNYIRYFHREGVQVGFADGHGRWIADNSAHQLRDLDTAYTGFIQDMRQITEDVWDALDGDVGYQVYSYVSRLY